MRQAIHMSICVGLVAMCGSAGALQTSSEVKAEPGDLKAEVLHSVELCPGRSLVIQSTLLRHAVPEWSGAYGPRTGSAARGLQIEGIAVSAQVVEHGERFVIWLKRLTLMTHLPDDSPRVRIMAAELSRDGLALLLAHPDGRVSLEIAPSGGTDRSAYLPDDWNVRAHRSLLSAKELSASIYGSWSEDTLTVSLIDHHNRNQTYVYRLSAETMTFQRK